VTLFDEFDCPVPEKIFLDTGNFMTILKRMKSNDILRLSTDEGNFIIEFQGDATRKYKLRLLDVEYEPPAPPTVAFPCTIKVPTNIVKDSIGDMEVFSEYCSFSVDEDYFIVTNDGEFGDTNIRYLHGEHITEYVKCGMTVSKLKDIFRASKLSEECILRLGTDMPLGVEFQLVTGDGGIRFLLAPRISNED
jgi:proliferating cell nuclear antigen